MQIVKLNLCQPVKHPRDSGRTGIKGRKKQSMVGFNFFLRILTTLRPLVQSRVVDNWFV